MAEVVGTWVVEVDGFGGRVEMPAPPVLLVVGRHPAAVSPTEQRCVGSGDVLHVAPRHDFGAKLGQEINCSIDATGLLRLQRPVRHRLRDQDGVLADVPPFKSYAFSRPDAGVGEDLTSVAEKCSPSASRARRSRSTVAGPSTSIACVRPWRGLRTTDTRLRSASPHSTPIGTWPAYRATNGLAADPAVQQVGPPLRHRPRRDLVQPHVAEARREVTRPAAVVADDRRPGQPRDGVGAVGRPQRGQGVVLEHAANRPVLRQLQRETRSLQVGTSNVSKLSRRRAPS